MSSAFVREGGGRPQVFSSREAAESAAVRQAAAAMPRDGGIARSRPICCPRPEKSMSSAAPSGRRSPDSRCIALAMPNRMAMQARKITQPSKACRKPSAWAMP